MNFQALRFVMYMWNSTVLYRLRDSLLDLYGSQHRSLPASPCRYILSMGCSTQSLPVLSLDPSVLSKSP